MTSAAWTVYAQAFSAFLLSFVQRGLLYLLKLAHHIASCLFLTLMIRDCQLGHGMTSTRAGSHQKEHVQCQIRSNRTAIGGIACRVRNGGISLGPSPISLSASTRESKIECYADSSNEIKSNCLKPDSKVQSTYSID
ncbi:hypothetical protein J3F84DRAFT_234910 [Trichoderma pleuroticola]